MIRKISLVFIAILVVNFSNAQDKAKYLQVNLPIDQRLDDLVSKLTLKEKIDMLAGYKDFFFHPVERLGIPAFSMADGPLGISSWGIHGRATAFPAGIMQAATWNRSLMGKLGDAYADEWRSRGIHYMLGPGVNIYRASKGGRNFEYFGEDPYLTSELVVPFINAVQSHGVAATIKHYVANDQEFDRYTVNTVVDERTLQEIYLPPFKAAVERGNVMAVMAAYNPINGEWNTQNYHTLNEILKGRYNFKGVVMSDWDCTYSTAKAANNGLDMEMGSYKHFTQDSMQAAIKNGTVSMTRLDDMVRRIFYPAITLGWLDRPQKDSTIPLFNLSTMAASEDAAREGMVLLKNEKNILPLSATTKKVAVIGLSANPFRYRDRYMKPTNNFVVGGGGSSKVNPWFEVTTLEGIMKNATAGTDIQYNDGTNLVQAAAVARKADVVIACIGFDSGNEVEGVDRPFKLPKGQDELVLALQAANPNVVVVLNAGGGVDMSQWVEKVPAILHSFYAGSEGGNVVGEVLFGKTNPSGKLPFSIEKKWEDAPAYGNYDENYLSKKDTQNIVYKEGIFVGYRHFDKKNIEPLFPFGFGLSYSSFSYSDLDLKSSTNNTEKCIASFTVTNTGTVDGYEVAQLYVHTPVAPVPVAVNALKGFEKIWLKKGESKKVSITMDSMAFSYFDVKSKSWKLIKGNHDILVGSSSRNLPLRKPVKIK